MKEIHPRFVSQLIAYAFAFCLSVILGKLTDVRFPILLAIFFVVALLAAAVLVARQERHRSGARTITKNDMFGWIEVELDNPTVWSISRINVTNEDVEILLDNQLFVLVGHTDGAEWARRGQADWVVGLPALRRCLLNHLTHVLLTEEVQLILDDAITTLTNQPQWLFGEGPTPGSVSWGVAVVRMPFANSPHLKSMYPA